MEVVDLGFLMLVGLKLVDGCLDEVDLSDYMVCNIVDELCCIDGVGCV